MAEIDVARLHFDTVLLADRVRGLGECRGIAIDHHQTEAARGDLARVLGAEADRGADDLTVGLLEEAPPTI